MEKLYILSAKCWCVTIIIIVKYLSTIDTNFTSKYAITGTIYNSKIKTVWNTEKTEFQPKQYLPIKKKDLKINVIRFPINAALSICVVYGIVLKRF